MYVSSITQEVSLRGHGSSSSTVHYTLLYRSYKFQSRALTLKMITSMVIKLETYSLRRDVLSRFTQGIDLYAFAKFRAFNTNLNNSAFFLYHFSVLYSYDHLCETSFEL